MSQFNDLTTIDRPEPIRVSVALAPNDVGRKEMPWNYLQSCKESRSSVSSREPSSASSQRWSSASIGADGRLGAPLKRLRRSKPTQQSLLLLHRSASTSSARRRTQPQISAS